jgi:Na+/melibiose symporter-like transporter
MAVLFRDARFRWLFGGQVACMVGDSILLLVLAVWVKDLTGSSGLAGAVILAVTAPTVFSPLLGWAVDRRRRRPFLIWTNVGSAAVLLPLFAVHGSGYVWLIYAVAVAYGVSFNLNSAGLAGLLKVLVPDERLADANSTLRTVREGLRLIGPLAGAGLYALAGPLPVVLVALVAFLLASAALTAVRVREQRPQPAGLHWMTEAGAGMRHILGDGPLRRGAVAMAVAFLVFGVVNSGVFAYVDQGLHRPAAFVGVLLTAMGVGSVAGGVVASRLIHRLGELGAIATGLTALAAGLGPLVLPHTWLGLSSAPLAGAGVSVVAVAFSTLMQRRTPAPLVGRVSTACDLLIGVPQTGSIAAGAVLVSAVDFRWMFATVAIGLAVTAGALWVGRGARPGQLAPVSVAPSLASGSSD